MSNLLIPGIVSVTFRSLSPEQIIRLAADNGLEAIEWGSDVHLKADDFDAADKIVDLSAKNGVMNISYGSYQGKGEDGEEFFRKTVETAERLKTSNIRIWAGAKNAEDVSAEERKQYVRYAGRLADIAGAKGIDISFECHKGTLTNTPDSAAKLIEEIGRKNVFMYWQPLQSESVQENKAIIRRFLPFLKNVHVYAWRELERFPLADHERAWSEYAEAVSLDGKEHGLLLEFVKNDDVRQLEQDARVLLKILGK